MDEHLHPIAAALAELTDAELDALVQAIERAPALSPGLLAFLAHAVDHDRARRDGGDFPLRGPAEAIPPDELGEAFATVAALMMFFRTHPRVRALIEAVGDTLAARPPEVLH